LLLLRLLLIGRWLLGSDVNRVLERSLDAGRGRGGKILSVVVACACVTTLMTVVLLPQRVV